jgi:hypothetical protein
VGWFDDNGIEHSGADMGPGGIIGAPPGPIALNDAGGGPDYQGPLPTGYSRDDVNDFLRRNAGHEGQGYDYGRVMSALNDRGGRPSAPAPSSGGFSSGAPASISPFTFDPSSVGKSDAFKFRFDKALEALQRTGASRGSYFSPQTWKAIEAEASGQASQEYGAEFGRQFDTHRWNEENRYNSQRSNRLDDFGIYDTNRRFDRGVYEDDRNFGRGVYQDDRNFDYGKNRDTMGDYWRFIDYGYNSARNPQ